MAVGMLAYRADKRWGYTPLLIGTIGSVAIVGGKFYFDSTYIGYAGTSLLIAAAIWNVWPRRKNTNVVTVLQQEPYCDENKNKR